MILDIYTHKQSFYEEYDTFCYQNCIRQILEYYNISHSNFYINTSLSFLIEINGENSYRIINEDVRGLIPTYKDCAKRIYPINKNGNLVWQENLEKLKKGIPLIVGVDSYYLPYLPYYKKSHGIHTVILTGYTEETNEVSIIDWFEPWFFKGNVRLDIFIEARNSKNEYDGGVFSGYPVYNNWAELEISGLNGRIDKLIDENIENSIHQYFRKYSKPNEKNGIHAWEYILNVLKEIKNNDYEHQKNFLKKLHVDIFKQLKRKYLFNRFLKDAYEEIDNKVILNLISNFDEIVAEWEILQSIAVKGTFKVRNDTFERLELRLERVIFLEKEIYKKLIVVKK